MRPRLMAKKKKTSKKLLDAIRLAKRHGDTIPAMINPQEAEMLTAMGGAGAYSEPLGRFQFRDNDSEDDFGGGDGYSDANGGNDPGDADGDTDPTEGYDDETPAEAQASVEAAEAAASAQGSGSGRNGAAFGETGYVVDGYESLRGDAPRGFDAPIGSVMDGRGGLSGVPAAVARGPTPLSTDPYDGRNYDPWGDPYGYEDSRTGLSEGLNDDPNAYGGLSIDEQENQIAAEGRAFELSGKELDFSNYATPISIAQEFETRGFWDTVMNHLAGILPGFDVQASVYPSGKRGPDFTTFSGVRAVGDIAGLALGAPGIGDLAYEMTSAFQAPTFDLAVGTPAPPGFNPSAKSGVTFSPTTGGIGEQLAGGYSVEDSGGEGDDEFDRSIAGVQLAAGPATVIDPFGGQYGGQRTRSSRLGEEGVNSRFTGRQSFAEGGIVGPGGAGLTPPSGGTGDIQAEVARVVQQNPEKFAQVKQGVEQAMQSGELTPQELNMMVQLAKAAAQNPQVYPQIRKFAIQQGLATEQDLSPQYDQGLVFVLLAVAQAMQSGTGGPPMMQSEGQPAQPMPQSDGQSPVASYAKGGPTPKSRNEDGSVAINAHEDEFVFSKLATMHFGKKRLQAMLDEGNGVSKTSSA